jgi:hypothetical protein
MFKTTWTWSSRYCSFKTSITPVTPVCTRCDCKILPSCLYFQARSKAVFVHVKKWRQVRGVKELFHAFFTCWLDACWGRALCVSLSLRLVFMSLLDLWMTIFPLALHTNFWSYLSFMTILISPLCDTGMYKWHTFTQKWLWFPRYFDIILKQIFSR